MLRVNLNRSFRGMEQTNARSLKILLKNQLPFSNYKYCDQILPIKFSSRQTSVDQENIFKRGKGMGFVFYTDVKCLIWPLCIDSSNTLYFASEKETTHNTMCLNMKMEIGMAKAMSESESELN